MKLRDLKEQVGALSPAEESWLKDLLLIHKRVGNKSSSKFWIHFRHRMKFGEFGRGFDGWCKCNDVDTKTLSYKDRVREWNDWCDT